MTVRFEGVENGCFSPVTPPSKGEVGVESFIYYYIIQRKKRVRGEGFWGFGGVEIFYLERPCKDYVA